MLISNKVKELLKSKKISQEELANKIGMTKNGLNNNLGSNDFKISTLIKISEVLDVPITYFFEDDSINNVNISNISGNQHINSVLNGTGYEEIKRLREKNKLLETRIAELEQLLAQKDQMIERLFKIHE